LLLLSLLLSPSPRLLLLFEAAEERAVLPE
jgi:hypothetical protein